MGSRYHGVFMAQVFLVGGWQSGLKNPRFFLHVPFTDILRVFRLFEQDILQIMMQIKIFSIV